MSTSTKVTESWINTPAAFLAADASGKIGKGNMSINKCKYSSPTYTTNPAWYRVAEFSVGYTSLLILVHSLWNKSIAPSQVVAFCPASYSSSGGNSSCSALCGSAASACSRIRVLKGDHGTSYIEVQLRSDVSMSIDLTILHDSTVKVYDAATKVEDTVPTEFDGKCETFRLTTLGLGLAKES